MSERLTTPWAVETAGAQQRRIEHTHPGRLWAALDDDSRYFPSSHPFSEQLVRVLFPRSSVARHRAGPRCRPTRIDFRR